MSKDKSIPLSPKHGVNPSLIKCFWCGKDKGVALLGKLKGDAEAPREIVPDPEPCDACKATMAKGVTLLEVSDDGSRFNGNTAFSIADTDGRRLWFTGRMAVLREGAELVKKYKAGSRVLVDDPRVLDLVLGTDKKPTKKGTK